MNCTTKVGTGGYSLYLPKVCDRIGTLDNSLEGGSGGNTSGSVKLGPQLIGEHAVFLVVSVATIVGNPLQKKRLRSNSTHKQAALMIWLCYLQLHSYQKRTKKEYTVSVIYID